MKVIYLLQSDNYYFQTNSIFADPLSCCNEKKFTFFIFKNFSINEGSKDRNISLGCDGLSRPSDSTFNLSLLRRLWNFEESSLLTFSNLFSDN